jgi:hypothetical protein
LVTVSIEDPSPEYVHDWMEARGYDFTVLWDDGYESRAGVRSWPETWVLDREGRMVFDFGSTAGSWGEEVGWMVEAVLEGGQDTP